MSALTPRQAVVLGRALIDAAAYRQERAGGYCAACKPGALCDDHVRDEELAGAYAALILELTTDTPAPVTASPRAAGAGAGTGP